MRGNPDTVVVNPFAELIRVYQRYVWLPGTLYGLILLVGLAGVALRWRRAGRDALLPWLCSVALIVGPAATAEFDYRYVTTAVPFACLAAAMAFGRRARGEQPDGSAGTGTSAADAVVLPAADAVPGSDPAPSEVMGGYPPPSPRALGRRRGRRIGRRGAPPAQSPWRRPSRRPGQRRPPPA